MIEPYHAVGAAQADVGILEVNSTRGEFETGFEAGGQTREHAMLVRSLGGYAIFAIIHEERMVVYCNIFYMVERNYRWVCSIICHSAYEEKEVVYCNIFL